MKRILLISLLIFSTAVRSNTWDDPSVPFDASKRMTDKVEITWVLVDNPGKACDAEGRKRFKNYKGLGYVPEACAIWEENKCLIITKKRPTMHELGHEVRHCFQGAWH